MPGFDGGCGGACAGGILHRTWRTMATTRCSSPWAACCRLLCCCCIQVHFIPFSAASLMPYACVEWRSVMKAGQLQRHVKYGRMYVLSLYLLIFFNVWLKAWTLAVLLLLDLLPYLYLFYLSNFKDIASSTEYIFRAVLSSIADWLLTWVSLYTAL